MLMGVGGGPLRVLIVRVPPAHFGGGVVQVQRLKSHLERTGIQAEISYETRPDVSAFDVVHVIHAAQPHTLYLQCAHVKDQGRPLVVTTSYWDWPAVDEHLARLWGPEPGMIRKRALERQLLGLSFHEAGVLLVNANAEKERLRRDFGLPEQRFALARLAWDEDFSQADPEPFARKTGLRDFILCVGSIGPEENQLTLVKALRDYPAPLVLVSRWEDPAYLRLCKEAASENAIFYGGMALEEIRSAYAAAKVHAATSVYDPMNFTTLAAGLAGCNNVCADNPCVREYVGPHAWFCNPTDEKDVRRAVEEAYGAPRSDALKEHLLSNFSWERHARESLAAYERAVAAEARPMDPRLRLLREHVAAVWEGGLEEHRSQEDALARALAGRDEELRHAKGRLAELERELKSVTGTRAYRFYHRVASSWLYRLIRGKRIERE